MVKLTLGFARNLRIEPLVDGSVKPQNVDLDFVMSPIGERLYRGIWRVRCVRDVAFRIRHGRERRDAAKWQWSGLPVFLSKAFHVWVERGRLKALDDDGIRALASRYGDPDRVLGEVL